MSKISELIQIIGSEEQARAILEATKDWSDELVEVGVKFKSADLDALLEGLSRDELKALYVEIGKLIKRRSGHTTISDTEGKKIIKLIYEPTKAEKSYVHPLAKSCEEGISAIEQQRLATKQKGRELGAMSRSFQEGLEAIEAERVNVRQHKGAGRWSNPPIEMSGPESIQAILEWRKQHWPGYGGDDE